jgi:hypothetical protein
MITETQRFILKTAFQHSTSSNIFAKSLFIPTDYVNRLSKLNLGREEIVAEVQDLRDLGFVVGLRLTEKGSELARQICS